jgi:hypothetical protein
MDRKPILCLDFDGVIHSYKSGWKGATCIPDPPVPGAMAFIVEASKHFEVNIFSSRSHEEGGIEAMRAYIDRHMTHTPAAYAAWHALKFPVHKPPATVSIDDRCLTFKGVWPDMETLRSFQPWWKAA